MNNSIRYLWDSKKNIALIKAGRPAFENGNLVADLENDTHPDQMMLIVSIKGYLHKVPYEVRGDVIWLITLHPSRKLNKIFRGV